MRRDGRTRELTVGITLTLALVIFAALVLLLGREKRIFHAKSSYMTTITNSLGLKPGSPVVMGGVQVGTVSSVSLPKDVHQHGIDLILSVDRAYGDRIRVGSIASVAYITLLSGEKLIDISPGDPSKPQLPQGATIPPDTSQSLLETGQSAAENLAKVTQDLREVLQTVNRGEGLAGRILKAQEPYFGEGAIKNIEATFARTNRLLERIEKGEGTVGTLITNREFAEQTLGSLRSASARFDRILAMAETNKGALSDLLKEDGQSQQALADLRTAAASFKTIMGRLESKTGLIGRLLNDAEYSEAVAKDLHTISASLASISAKIDRGEGSLGGFVNDPAVYQGMQDIVSGIRKSKSAKFLLRHYGKKGAKAAPQSGMGTGQGGKARARTPAPPGAHAAPSPATPLAAPTTSPEGAGSPQGAPAERHPEGNTAADPAAPATSQPPAARPAGGPWSAPPGTMLGPL